MERMSPSHTESRAVNIRAFPRQEHVFYAAKHKSIHLQWRNVGQTCRMQDCVLGRTTPIRLCQEPLEDKVPVLRAEFSQRKKEVSWEVGRCYVIRQSFFLGWPQPKSGGRHHLQPLSQLLSQHTQSVLLTSPSPATACALAITKKSRSLCCTCKSPWGMHAKPNNK